jgi:hypothetical protein
MAVTEAIEKAVSTLVLGIKDGIWEADTQPEIDTVLENYAKKMKRLMLPSYGRNNRKTV